MFPEGCDCGADGAKTRCSISARTPNYAREKCRGIKSPHAMTVTDLSKGLKGYLKSIGSRGEVTL